MTDQLLLLIGELEYAGAFDVDAIRQADGAVLRIHSAAPLPAGLTDLLIPLENELLDLVLED